MHVNHLMVLLNYGAPGTIIRDKTLTRYSWLPALRPTGQCRLAPLFFAAKLLVKRATAWFVDVL